MNAPGSVLVVGGSAAGLSTAEALRRKGYTGTVTVLGGETHQPYDRPPLSKQVLAGEWEPGRATLRDADALAELDVEFVLGESAVGLDVARRTVGTSSGRELSADAIVLATGLHPRTLPGVADLAGAHVLRTIEDSAALRADLLSARKLVVVGEGVLGSEIAATARKMGLEVTLAGPLATPMFTQLGPLVGGALADMHTDAGVKLRLGVGVAEVTGANGRVTGVRLATGERLPADVVVVAIGADPNTGWLAGSGLEIENGVVCDSRCRAADGIYAVGDVARWLYEPTNTLVRLENRTNATEQARAVAANILGDDTPYQPCPYFWTDQYDLKIQTHGIPHPEADVSIVEGAIADGRFVARYERDGTIVAVVGWKMPKQARLRRQEVVDALFPSTPEN